MRQDNLTFDDLDEAYKLGDAGQGENTMGLTCELRSFEGRYNSKGERVILDVGSRWRLEPPRDKASDSGLVLTRFYDRDKELEYTELEIRSPHIKAALRQVVPEYSLINLRTTKVVLRDHPSCLFHYRKELQTYGSTLQDPEAVKHLVFALRYMYKSMQSEIYSYYNLVESSSNSPSIDFLNLWMVFRPGDYMYTKSAEVERVLKFKEMRRCKCPIPWCYSSRWTIVGEDIDYDGTDFGYTKCYFYIKPYDGYKALIDLKVMPLQYHPKKDSIAKAMIARGKKFIGLHGTHHRMYEGVAEALAPDRRVSLLGEEDEFPLRSTLIKGRILIDAKTFYLARPSHEIYFESSKKVIRTENDDHLQLGDDDYIMCHYMIPGFSLVDKRWCLFQVDLINEVDYNAEAFDTLMLEEEQKQMILSLVKVHTDERLLFDDVIKGKGRGMIFLLHGVPGVGKTLTAESVADFCRRPLYSVSSGELGTSAISVEKGLSDAIHLATTWNAVILIDEADVFLEQRSSHDLERNGLVSVFLRVLEYYEGIMILTTNRIGTFDEAFKSRIHLAIKYPALTHVSRRDLWRAFIFRVSPESGLDWMNMASLDKLAEEDLNGRQIKNIVRTAHALAVSQNSDLLLSHINMALRVMKTFEVDFAEDAKKRRLEDATSTVGERASKRKRLS